MRRKFLITAVQTGRCLECDLIKAYISSGFGIESSLGPMPTGSSTNPAPCLSSSRLGIIRIAPFIQQAIEACQ